MPKRMLLKAFRQTEMRMQRVAQQFDQLRRLCCAAAVVATLALAAGCSDPAASPHAGGGPFYSLGVADNSTHPVKPVHDVSKSEAEKHDTFGAAYYDEKGRIISYAKNVAGHQESFCRYFYDDKSVFEHEECRDDSGTTTKKYFGADGSLLRTESDPSPG
jgi:hypothetical protein